MAGLGLSSGSTGLSLVERGSSVIGRGGLIKGIGDKEQGECVDGHIGAARAETNPTQLLAVHDCEDDHIYGGCDESNSSSNESTPSEASEARGEPVRRTVEGMQEEAAKWEISEKNDAERDMTYQVNKTLRIRS